MLESAGAALPFARLPFFESANSLLLPLMGVGARLWVAADFGKIFLQSLCLFWFSDVGLFRPESSSLLACVLPPMIPSLSDYNDKVKWLGQETPDS